MMASIYDHMQLLRAVLESMTLSRAAALKQIRQVTWAIN